MFGHEVLSVLSENKQLLHSGQYASKPIIDFDNEYVSHFLCHFSLFVLDLQHMTDEYNTG